MTDTNDYTGLLREKLMDAPVSYLTHESIEILIEHISPAIQEMVNEAAEQKYAALTAAVRKLIDDGKRTTYSPHTVYVDDLRAALDVADTTALDRHDERVLLDFARTMFDKVGVTDIPERTVARYRAKGEVT